MEVFETVTMEERMVDEDSPAEPIGSPSPATPSPSAPSAEIQTDIDSWEKPKTHIDARIKDRRIKPPNRRAPYIHRIVVRNVEDTWICRFDGDRALPVLVLRINCQLRRRVQGPFRLGFCTHALHRLHHLGLLGEKGIAKLCGPADVAGQPGKHLGKGNQSLYTGVPVLFLCLVHELGRFPFRMVPDPLFSLGDLYRICGGRQDLAYQRIGI